MKYIRICNWDKFQHYTKRNPPWIKLHISLLDNENFECLHNDSKVLLICLWLFAARKGNGNVPVNLAYLQRKLPVGKKVKLQPLIDAGFIEVDSIVQASCAQSATPETETETETEGEGEKTLCCNSDEFQLAQLLLDEILKRKKDFKHPNIQTWAVHTERMIRLDKRAPDRIAAVIRWCQADSFWQSNILSTRKLREKFDQLELRMSGGRPKETVEEQLGRLKKKGLL